MVDLEALVDRPLELDWITLDLWRLEAMLKFSVRTQQAAAVSFEAAPGVHEAELDCEPEEARHGFDVACEALQTEMRIANGRYTLRGGVGTFSETHQRVRERPISVHRDVARDVMKDVGFGQVVQTIS